MQFDMTKTGILLKKIALVRPLDSFLVDTYFPYSPANMHKEDKVYFDTKKGGRKVAPMISEYGKTKELLREPYQTDAITPPKIGGSRSITPEMVAKRIAGENIFSGGLTPDKRAAMLEAEDMKDILNSIKRRQELMVRQLFLTGTVTAIAGFDDDSVVNDVNIDYGMSADLMVTLSGTDKWDNSSSDPYEQLIAKRSLVNERSGLIVTSVLLGRSAWKALRNHANYKSMFTQYNPAFNFGEMSPAIKGNGITYLGRINEAAIDLYMYDGYVHNPTTGLAEPTIPDDCVLGIPSEFGDAFSMQYGAITYLNREDQYVTVDQPLIPRSFSDQRNSVKGIQIESRCLPVIHIVDSFFKMKVV